MLITTVVTIVAVNGNAKLADSSGLCGVDSRGSVRCGVLSMLEKLAAVRQNDPVGSTKKLVPCKQTAHDHIAIEIVTNVLMNLDVPI